MQEEKRERKMPELILYSPEWIVGQYGEAAAYSESVRLWLDAFNCGDTEAADKLGHAAIRLYKLGYRPVSQLDKK